MDTSRLGILLWRRGAEALPRFFSQSRVEGYILISTCVKTRFDSPQSGPNLRISPEDGGCDAVEATLRRQRSHSSLRVGIFRAAFLSLSRHVWRRPLRRSVAEAALGRFLTNSVANRHRSRNSRDYTWSWPLEKFSKGHFFLAN